jgi:hypothetical protein
VFCLTSSRRILGQHLKLGHDHFYHIHSYSSSSTMTKQNFQSLRMFFQTPSSFHFFAFRNNIFFYKARSSALRQTPNMEGQVPVFTCPSDMVAQLCPQAPGSLFVAFYDSQGYGGGIVTRLHTGIIPIHYSPLPNHLLLYVPRPCHSSGG